MPDDRLKAAADAIRALARKQVLVGIPMENDPREGEPMGYASLGYVFEFGSPAINMPARPHLVPGVEAVMDEVKARLTAAARVALDGNPAMADQYLHQVGQTAVNSVRGLIDAKLAPPIQPESYLARTSGRAAKRERAKRAGMSLAALARAEAPQATPLVDTGGYRRAIVYAIRERGE